MIFTSPFASRSQQWDKHWSLSRPWAPAFGWIQPGSQMLDVVSLAHIFWVVYWLLTWASLSRDSKSLQIQGFQSPYWNAPDLAIPQMKYIEKQYSSLNHAIPLDPWSTMLRTLKCFLLVYMRQHHICAQKGKFWHIRSVGRAKPSVLRWRAPPHSIFLFLQKKTPPLLLSCYLASHPKHAWYVRRGQTFTSRKPIRFPKLETQIQQSIS